MSPLLGLCHCQTTTTLHLYCSCWLSLSLDPVRYCAAQIINGILTPVVFLPTHQSNTTVLYPVTSFNNYRLTDSQVSRTSSLGNVVIQKDMFSSIYKSQRRHPVQHTKCLLKNPIPLNNLL